jgi:hypothetical protein
VDVNSVEAAALVVVLLIAWSMYRAQRDPNFREFNLFDLIMEHGRVSRLACAFWLGVGVMSWVVIRMALDGKITDGIFIGYGTALVAPIVAKLFTSPPADPPQ